jgi:two-component system chemotaxis response regulator CheB
VTAHDHRPVEAIAIGASAGGLTPLRAVVAGLPADLPATVLVVLHVAATGTSVLPQILDRSCALEVIGAEDGIALRPGLVVVARPDHHLLVEDGHVRLGHGPRENGHRPAVDPLMRSLARAYGPAAAGVILSGTRDDGTLGLTEIKRAGGRVLVQDPEEAEYPSMPASAAATTEVDGALPAAALALALTALTRGEVLTDPVTHRLPPRFLAGGAPLTITCPDCGGVLTEADELGVLHFRCHVGHAYSPRSLLALHAENAERAMWTAARLLEDRSMLLTRLADRSHAAGHVVSAAAFTASAANAEREAGAIREAIAALDDGLSADDPEGQVVDE